MGIPPLWEECRIIAMQEQHGFIPALLEYGHNKEINWWAQEQLVQQVKVGLFPFHPMGIPPLWEEVVIIAMPEQFGFIPVPVEYGLSREVNWSAREQLVQQAKVMQLQFHPMGIPSLWEDIMII